MFRELTALQCSTIFHRSDNHQSEHFSSSAGDFSVENAKDGYTYRKASPPVAPHALLLALHLPVLYGSPDASDGLFTRHVTSFRSTRILESGKGSEFAAARPPAAKASMMLNLIVPFAVSQCILEEMLTV